MAQQRRQRRQPQGRKKTATRKGSVLRSVKSSVTWEIPWTNVNLVGILVGIGIIVIGFWLMSTAIAEHPMTDKSIWNNASSTTVAPIILTIAYFVIIPIAIFWRSSKTKAMHAAADEGEDEPGS